MRKPLLFVAVLPLAFLLSGCAAALMSGSQPTDVKLALRTPHPERHVARVALEPPVDYPVASDGRVEFKVPSFQHGDTYYFLGIKLRDGSAERLRVVEVRRGSHVVRRLSLDEIANLPTNAAGYRVVTVQN